jgi:ketosteroid isomerase-like protein
MPRVTSDDLVIRGLADRAEILEVVVAYATALDGKDWRALGSLFAAEAIWEYEAGGEQVIGPEAIAARIAGTLERLRATQHFCGNHSVRVDGDEAWHTCYYQAQHVGRDGETFLGAGRYTDRLSRTADGWRFTHRMLSSVWTSGNPAVVTG